ncbi:hypothetical protein ACQKGC_01090 [Allorhizobium pseudoryzae]|jgi:hypothetical protein|uniref:hypothetical protein n=1 Tax=Allorhizobium pseudoryzae TaxID=379684 RepID=UPI0013ECFF31|nr:hypothetical protein [Allorhizobium pseudoryzae]
MHGSKTSDNTLAWATFLASYLLIVLMISVPIGRQPDSPGPRHVAAASDRMK